MTKHNTPASAAAAERHGAAIQARFFHLHQQYLQTDPDPAELRSVLKDQFQISALTKTDFQAATAVIAALDQIKSRAQDQPDGTLYPAANALALFILQARLAKSAAMIDIQE